MLSLVLFALSPGVAAGQVLQDPVAENLTRWRQQFRAIEVEYRIASRRQLEDRFGSEQFASDFLADWGHHGRLVWAGADRFILDLARLEHGEIVDVRRWGRNDIIAWMAEGSRSRTGHRARTHWWAVTLRLARHLEVAMGTRVDPLTGLFDPGQAVWIDDILSDTDVWSARELVAVDGHECLELTSTLSQPDRSTGIQRRFALDPAVGYLPRQGREILFWGSGEVGRIYSESTYLVTEFQEVQPGFWFPRRGTWHISEAAEAVYEWEVVRVVVDPELPEEFAAPPDAEKVMFPEAEALARLARGAEPGRVDAWLNWSLAIGLLLMGSCAAALALRWMGRA